MQKFFYWNSDALNFKILSLINFESKSIGIEQ